jgi:hypothetical protein
MDKKDKKRLYTLCDPYKIPQDPNITIKIDEFYPDNTLVRGFHWAEKLFKKISYGDGNTIQLFTGYSGSGKTTELKTVQEMLENDGYLVVYINGDDYIDTTKEIEISDIYNAILYNVVVSVNKKFTDEGYFKRLKNFLKTEVNMKNIKIEDIVLEMKDNPTLRQKVSRYIVDNFSSFKKDIRSDLYRLNTEVKKTKEGIVVIFDSLEKNKGITSNYNEVIKACENLFSNRDNLSMSLDIIYTVPPYLSQRARLIDIDFLPAVKLKDKDDKDFQKGIDLLKALVKKRINEKELQILLGKNYEEKLETIIKFSGGYVRDMLEILRMIIIEDNYPVSDEAIDKIIYNEINSFNELMDTPTINELKKVKKAKSINDITEMSMKDKLLTNHLILRYRNKNLWFDVHPAVRRLLNEKK